MSDFGDNFYVASALYQQQTTTKPVETSTEYWHMIGFWSPGRNVLDRPRSMQAIDLNSQRWHVIGSRSPVAKPSADAPHPVNKS